MERSFSMKEGRGVDFEALGGGFKQGGGFLERVMRGFDLIGDASKMQVETNGGYSMRKKSWECVEFNVFLWTYETR